MVDHIVHLEDDHHLFNIFRAAFQVTHPALKIVQFTDSQSLLTYLLQSPQPVDVAILDIRVPGSMSGVELAQEIRKTQYPLHLFITSAYTEPERRVLAALDAEFIPKPWDIQALVSQVLELTPPGQKRGAKGKSNRRKAPAEEQAGHVSAPPPAFFSEQTARELTHTLELLKTAFRAEAAALLLSASQSETAGSKNPPITVFAHPAAWNIGKPRLFMLSFAAQIIEQQTALLVDDVRPYLTGTQTGLEVISYAGIPINTLGFRGVLCVMDGSVRAWREDEYQLLCKTAEVLQSTLETHAQVQALEGRNESLYAYSSTIAHDLKAPLGAIMGYTDVVRLLLGVHATSPQIDQYLTSITDSASAMSDMITRLLWLAKLDHPQAAVVAVDTTTAIHAALMRLHYHIERRGVQVIMPEEFPPVIGHEAWVEEVFANLISNAVKYMGDDNPQPTLEIAYIYPSGTEYVRFEVRDNGIGISQDDLHKLFASFSRLNKVAVEGLGLGLVIVRRIVIALGGELGVESEVGRGSTFWFTLPRPSSQ
jgi:signal transduction histidine kinase/DNA-binding response OmpR family regulator